MKTYLYILAMVVVAGLAGCNKSVSSGSGYDPVSLDGKWNLTAYYFSTGAAGGWHPVTGSASQWIDFKANGAFASNLAPYDTAATYQVVDSFQVKFTNVSSRYSTRYFYTLDSINHILQLSPADLICIEGCAQKFSR